MASALESFLNERYLNNTDKDLGVMMSTAYDEYNNNTVISTSERYVDLFYEERLIKNGHNLPGRFYAQSSGYNDLTTPINHVIFAQNIINESKTGKLFKTAQLFISSLATESNNATILPFQLGQLFKSTQGLVEVPIHLILYIGGLYDFYYYGTPDNDINLKTINGISNKDGDDLLSDMFLLNKHYGSYAFDDTGLKASTIPFVKPITPRFIDDSMSFNYESYKDQSITKNYTDTYYDYELKKDIQLSNNISSHIPFSGYGVLNNYLNSMSRVYFGEGLDGQTNEETNLNDDGIPYHIIGNFRGKLKTFKTYNDQNINFMGSYNSYGPSVKFDLPAPESNLNTITTTLTFDSDFIYTDKNNKEKIEFFLLLSKLKSNFLGGYMDTVDIYNIVRKLCTVNNLKAKQDGIEIPDFITLLVHTLMPPDGKEPDAGNNRPNRILTILDEYNVDPRSFDGYIDVKTNEYVPLYNIIYIINNLTGDDLYDYISRYLTSVWSKEFNQKEKSRLKNLDSKGTFVVYPSCGGEIDIKNLFTQNDFDYGLSEKKSSINAKYEYQKTNVVHTIFETQGDAYLKTLKYNDGSFFEYDDVSNDILRRGGANTLYLYSRINSGLIDFFNVNQNINKFEDKKTIPLVNPSLDNALLNKYAPVYFKPEAYLTDSVTINYFDRYDDIYIVANTTDPEGIKKLKFDNKSLIYNTSRLFWFDTPKYSGVIYPETIKFGAKNLSEKPKLISVDYYEYKHFHLKNKSVYPYQNGESFYDVSFKDQETIRTYDEFKSGTPLYSSYDKIVETADNVTKYYSDNILAQDNNSAKMLLDVFDIDKLEDFRSLFKKFSDESQESYFTKTFNTFDFKSLLKHTTMFGYTNLPNNISLDGRSFSKDELLALLCGYSGSFIEFASTTGLAKLINTALTLGQQDKAKFVIDEFLNAKITVNNYSTGGPLSIEGTDVNNPSGLRLNSFVFNPIVAYASNTRSYETISSALGDVLLFRTILFGDQPITAYSDLDPNIDELVKKYVFIKGMVKGIDPKLDDYFIINELTRTFFRKLNIQLNENNIKLLMSYLRGYIADTLYKTNALNISNIKYFLFDYSKDNYDSASIYPTKEGAKNQVFDYNLKDWVTISEIKNGVLKSVNNPITYSVISFDELNSDTRFTDFIRKFNKDFVEKTLITLNGSLTSLHDKLIEKLNGASYGSETGTATYDEIAKDEIEIRTGTYYRIKSLYDKNVSFTNLNINDDRLIKKDSKELGNADVNAILNSPLFFNFNVQQQDICDDAGLIAPSSEVLKDLVDYISVVDRGNNPFGTKVLVDIVSLKQTLSDDLFKASEIDKATSKSMWTILSKLASDHEFLLMPLTSYINLSGGVTEKGDPYALAHDMFGVFNNLEMWESNPAFIFQYSSLTSSINTGNKQKVSAKSNFDLSNTFCLDVDPNSLDVDGNGKILNEDAPSDVRNSKVSSFVVDFANQNQNMFESIQISTDEFANTEESIKAQVGLVATDNQPVLSTGKLFSAMENRSYSCTVTSLGNATIQPLTYFYLRNVPLFYGTYWITNVSHKIAPNTMTTTFKGVRQPIARKPTPNVAVIRALLKRANELSLEQGYLDRNDTTPIPTSGPIYIDRVFSGVTGTTSETKYGLLYQKATDSNVNKYVTYNGLWVIASYLKLMTGGDETDTTLIKTLIAYLHNNASVLAEDTEWDIQITAAYFIDIVAYDLYHKLGYGVDPFLSLSDLLDNYNTTTGDAYQTALYKILEFEGKPNELVTYLTLTTEEKYDPKTTLITNSNDKAIGNDGTYPKITFPNTISETTFNAITRVNYWISDSTPNNYQTFNGLSTYELTQKFDTTPATANTGLTPFALTSQNQVALANAADNTYVATPTLYPPINVNLNQTFKETQTLPQGTSPLAIASPTNPLANAQFNLQTFNFLSINPTGNTNNVVNAGTREIGTQKDGSFDFSKAFSGKFKPKGYSGDNDVVAYVMGAYGKNKQYSFFKMCFDKEKWVSDTLKMTEHSFIDLTELGKDTGNATGDTKNNWTILNSTTEQTTNIYVAPVQSYRGNGLVAGWVEPVKGYTITSPFGPRWGRQHKGLDLGVPVGTPVYSSYDGTIVGAGLLDPDGYGNVIVIKHEGANVSTIYGHLSEFAFSETGTNLNKPVKAGDVIGKSGGEKGAPGAGSSGGPHLHYEVRTGLADTYGAVFGLTAVDPEPYIKGEVISDNTEKGTALTSKEKAKKGADIAKKLMGDLGLTNIQAAGIVGNLIGESGLIPDRIQGGGVKVGKLRINGVTGYGYAQWTSSNRQQNLANYAKSFGVDYTQQNLTDEVNYGFMVKEFKDSYQGILTKLKSKTTIRSATELIMKEWEVPADQSDGKVSERTGYSQQVLDAMG